MDSLAELGDSLESVGGAEREKVREWRSGIDIANLEQKKKAR